ncbi:UDP:flavonoid glycosyltransferase YjiC (YdhE family) [Kitasatospora sp. MAP12-15]|uniref:glycosyltransferase n=1 Tax=unclassified Kitasatospora TaxID=2633591 RepID=UPI00247333D0|nr:glycosyltransferase [Kitasatospora sp. MAP12-44]MDH6115000.1 UDP:flavonoid glycosyltransferase YjiC (YdhE family) [Kitasatospora sp. MAP12-44]
MRILFTSTEGSGHFHPLVPFIDACTRRGDDVLVLVPPKLEATVAARPQPYRIGGAPPAAETAALWERFPKVSRAEASVIANRELFGRLFTAALLPAVEQACQEWRPDLVLHDPCEYASVVAAERLGIAHAQVAISQAEAESGSLRIAAPALEPYGGRIVERLRETPYLTRFPASLDPSPYPLTHRFREAAEVAAPRERPARWGGDGRLPLVYLSFGTVAGGLPVGAAACRAALAAVDGLPVRVLLTLGHAAEAAELGPIPANVQVEGWIPQAEVLSEAALVLCHGGSGTTFGALAAGVPLVVVPLFADQPANGRLVQAAGAGLVVTPTGGEPGAMGVPGPEDVPRIRESVQAVLADPGYREAAQRLAQEMRATPSVDELLDGLLAR